MSKRIARQRKKGSVKPKKKSRRELVIIVCLLLSLTSAVGSMAWWRSLPGMTKPAMVTPPGNFNANSPSKEYIYAGGRLIATEEPAGSNNAPLAPTNLIASAISTTQINLSWSAPEGATGYSYLLERSTNYSTSPDHGFVQIATVSGISYTDTVSATPVATYLYRVRSISGQQQSAPGILNFATTKSFQEQISNQDPPGRTTIKATHFLELQEAVNAVRASAGLNAFTWSDPQGRAPASGVPILKSHLLDLRNGLNQALSALGITPQPYTDEALADGTLPAGTFVKKAHIDELRQRTRSVGQ